MPIKSEALKVGISTLPNIVIGTLPVTSVGMIGAPGGVTITSIIGADVYRRSPGGPFKKLEAYSLGLIVNS